MKAIACADLHLSDKAPSSRNADYPEQCLEKFSQIFEAAVDNDCPYIVVAGDFFDKPIVSLEFLNKVIKIRTHFSKIKLVTIPGQHDMKYHQLGTLNKTAYGILKEAGLIIHMDVGNWHNGIVGLPWETELSEKDMQTDMDILLVHRMVTESGPLFEGQTDWISGKGLLEQYPRTKFIISGDNHKPHIVKDRSRCGGININCGSMMRKSKDQMNYKPCMYCIDTDTGEYEMIPFVIEDNVWDMVKIELDERKQDSKKELQAFLDSLDSGSTRPDFESILEEFIESRKPSKAVRDIIDAELAGTCK